jgi:hypothetical protein
MSCDVCAQCGAVVRTTCSPNKNEGYFLSDWDIEQLELKINTGEYPYKELNLRQLFRKHDGFYLVFCDTCQARLREHPVNVVARWRAELEDQRV